MSVISSARVCLFTFTVLSSFMLRLASRCTLFPYTTLFRSPAAQRNEGDLSPRELPRAVGPVRLVAVHVATRDRKSTRLNSSHVSFSYVVFCVKKIDRHDSIY